MASGRCTTDPGPVANIMGMSYCAQQD